MIGFDVYIRLQIKYFQSMLSKSVIIGHNFSGVRRQPDMTQGSPYHRYLYSKYVTTDKVLDTVGITGSYAAPAQNPVCKSMAVGYGCVFILGLPFCIQLEQLVIRKVQDPIVLWNLITQVLDRGCLAASDAGIYKDIAPFHCFLHKN